MNKLKEYYVTVKFLTVVQVENENQIPAEMKNWFDDTYNIDFDYELDWKPVCDHIYESYCEYCGIDSQTPLVVERQKNV